MSQDMTRQEMLSFLKAEPFHPIRVGLTDGRSILIRHPDQAVVSNRMLCVGVTRVARSEPLVTPGSGDEIAREMFWTDLLHIVSVEPVEEAA